MGQAAAVSGEIVSAGALEARLHTSRAVSAASAEVGLAVARSFGARLVRTWWQALTADAVQPEPLRQPQKTFDEAALPRSVEILIESVGASAAKLDPERAAFEIGNAYTALLPAEYRAMHGVYYTPPSLSHRLIERATEAGVDWGRARILDPACGGGAFLTPVAARMTEALSDCSPPILIENLGARLRGYEIDPFGAWLAQVALDAFLLPLSRSAGRRLPDVVTVCDALQSTPPRELFDLVIGNPPYGRVRLDADSRARYKRSLYGHANLYGLFTDMALRSSSPGGVVAYVTPTSFLAGEYFKNLRSLMGRDAPPKTIDFIAARKGVFDDVLQETLLATYRCSGTSEPVEVHVVTARSRGTATVAYAGTCSLPSDPSRPWIMPREPRQAPLAAQLTRMPHRLLDWGYSVSTGPLVWNRHKAQLSRCSGPDCYPLIWAEAVSQDGSFVHRADKKNHTLFFRLRPQDDWLRTTRPCVLVQRTTAKEQARRLIAACLPEPFLRAHRGCVVVENHLNMLRPLTGEPAVTPEVLAAFLNSATADLAFRCLSGSVAVSASELEELPLPPPGEMEALAELVSRGADKTLIEAEIARLYRLTE